MAGRGRRGSADNPARAVALAHRVQTINPLTVDPLYTAANAELAIPTRSGRSMRRDGARAYLQANPALGFLKKATEVQPDNARRVVQLGLFELYPEQADPVVRARSLRRVQPLQRARRAETGQHLLRRWRSKIVNSGKAKC